MPGTLTNPLTNLNTFSCNVHIHLTPPPPCCGRMNKLIVRNTIAPMLGLLALVSAAVAQTSVPLRINCPPNLTNWVCGGSFAFVNYPPPTTVGSCPTNATFICSPPSGGTFILGTTTVTCRATNSCRESAVCSFTVTVARDTNAPVIQCPGNTQTWVCGTASTTPVSFPIPSATDNADTSVNVTCSPPSGSPFPIGTTTVACTATDDCTNRTTCTFFVQVTRDTIPPSIICPTNVVASICSTCAVSQCVANVPTPIRPASVGNGLFYRSSVEPDLTFTEFSEQMLLRAQNGYHPVHVNAYQPVDSSGTASVKFGAAWVRDDDSAFPYGYGVVVTVAQLQAEEQAQQASRPISLSGYKTSANESRFAVAYLRDDSAYPWRLILDRDFDQYQAEFEALAAQGFRPISVSGYSFHGENPRYSGIFVQDGLTGNDWGTVHRIAEADFQAWHDQYSNQDFQPISLSAYTIGEETFFTAVMVRVPNSGPYVAGHGMTENEFLDANAAWTDPANEFNTTLRPVVVAAYRSFYNGGAKRYAAVWRGSAPRALTATGVTQPSLAALDNAMEDFMQLMDINAASLCVSKNGSIVHHRGYNWAPREFKQTQPCSRFRIASSSKAVTATAVMKLLEGNYFVGMKGGGLAALTLDTPVFQMVGMPDLPAAYGRDAQAITIRHLLQHQAGWGWGFEPLYEDLQVAAALNKDVPVTRQDVIDYMMTPGLWPTPGDSSTVGFPGLFPPGSAPKYSNFGFSILAKLIEVVSHQPYEIYVSNHILLPVGANRMHLGYTARLLAWQGPDEVTYTAGNSYNQGGIDLRRWYVSDSNYDPLNIFNPTTQSRVGFGEPGSAFPTSAYGRYNMHSIDAAGGWVATSDDLVRLLTSFDSFNPNQPNTGTLLLDWDSVWEMWSNPLNIFDFDEIGDKYVLGWQQTTRNTPAGNVIVHSHGGNVDGVLSTIVRRSDGVSFAAMFSREAGGGAFSALNTAVESITSWPVCSDRTIVEYPKPFATDNADASVSVVCVPPTGSSFPLGSTTVTCTATDNCGNSRTCTFRVTVKVDNTPPAIQCPTNRVVWTCSTNGAVVTFPLPGVDDDTDSNPSVTCAPPSGSLFPVGRTVVTCTATDDCTNRSTCQFTVAVNADTIRPVIVCPTDQIAWTCGPTGAVVSFPAPVVADNHDSNPSVVCVPPSGGVFPIGQTLVTCTATDNCTNRSQCVFRVIVHRDGEAPTLECPANTIVWTCDPNGVVVNYPAPTANDEGDATPTIVCSPASGTLFPPGLTVVTCTATDDCGNRNMCSFEVRLARDTTPPTIHCPADVSLFSCSTTGRVVIFSPPTADDNNDGAPTMTCVPPSHSVFPIGTTVVTCTAEDDCGNRSQCSFRVSVALDVLPPAITCPGDIVVNTCDPRGVVVTWPEPEVTDNYIGNPQHSCTPHSGSVFPIGMTTVRCEAQDSCGNRSQCSFKVTVVADAEIPGTDTNGDGLSDIWQAHFNAHGLAPGDDTDRDGAMNAAEAAAGTDPRNAASRLAIDPSRAGYQHCHYIDGRCYEITIILLPYQFSRTKNYQLQVTPRLGGNDSIWIDLGPPTRGSDDGTVLRATLDDTNLPPTISTQNFFRVEVFDVDGDGDRLTAWEESVIGTSDFTPNTHGNPGGDHQAAQDWIAGQGGQARLREVALAHIGGNPNGPTQTKLVTATGTGGWLKLSSWTLNPATHDPLPLQDTAPFAGWNAKLHVLEPPLSPTLALNPFVSGRIRDDDNLWLTTRRVDSVGAHSEFETIGYGASSSLRVYDYAMAHRAVTGSGNVVDRFILITPVMGLNTGNQRELRIVTWSINPFTGDINGLFDTGNLGHSNLPDDGGRLQIVPEAGSRYVVSYVNESNQLSSWFFDIEPTGIVTPRSGGTSGVDIRGDVMDPVSSTDFALGALNSGGFVTLLAGADCAGKLAVWEDRVRVAGDTTATGEPFYVSDNSFDLNPNGPGVQVVPPILPDSWQDTASPNDEFGRAVAVGDFNGDGRADVAIGAPGQDLAKDGAPTVGSAGLVSVMYGRTEGLTGTYPDRFWSQDSDGVAGEAESGDVFGHALAAGDFNGDGFADLAIGAPFEDVDGVPNAGAVTVLYGSILGLRSDGNQLWFQGAGGLAGTPGEDDWFGYALVAGDFNGDGRADLALGVPHETVNGVAEAGAVQILYGSANGLSAAAGPGTQYLHQDSPSMLGALESEDHFGIALAAGDINNDGRDDLVIGIPQESVNGVLNAGAVQVIYGAAGGLSGQNQLVHQGTIEPAMEAFPAASELGDSFGWNVAVGDFNGDGFADVAMGVPYENIENGDITDAGVVHVLRGSAGGLTAMDHQLLSQVLAEHGDTFGFALAAGDFDGDGRADLAVGSPNENVNNNSVGNAGAVDVFHGAANGLAYATSFYQGALGNGGYEETAEFADGFAFALAAGDLNGDGRADLVVGVPDEDLLRDDVEQIDAGVIHAIYGAAAGLSGEADQVWAQGLPHRVRVLLTHDQREETYGIGGGKLFEKMPSGERTNVHVASVTKTMTLLLAVELLQTAGANVSLSEDVPVSEMAAGTVGSHVDLPYGAALEEGDEMPLELLLYGMMLRSCNKSSVAIAEHLGRKQYQFLHGSIPNDFDACGYFVTNMMQGKAAQLDMVNTLFGHPAGGTITPPQDLVNLWRYAWQFLEFRRFSTDTEWIDQGENAQGQPKIWVLEKHSAEGGYPGLEGWKGGNGGLWKGTFPFGIPLCTSSVLGQATRLEHTLVFALAQTGDRWGSVRQLLDYGYRLLFTPDYRGGGGVNTPPITDFAVRKIHDTLAVSAVIYGTDQLRLDAWQVVAGIGQVAPLNASTLTINNLAAGTHAPRTKILDVTKLPTVGESEADYLTGHLDGGDLRLNVWRVAAEPGY